MVMGPFPDEIIWGCNKFILTIILSGHWMSTRPNIYLFPKKLKTTGTFWCTVHSHKSKSVPVDKI